jgi:hypothetical protein
MEVEQHATDAVEGDPHLRHRDQPETRIATEEVQVLQIGGRDLPPP